MQPQVQKHPNKFAKKTFQVCIVESIVCHLCVWGGAANTIDFYFIFYGVFLAPLTAFKQLTTVSNSKSHGELVGTGNDPGVTRKSGLLEQPHVLGG